MKKIVISMVMLSQVWGSVAFSDEARVSWPRQMAQHAWGDIRYSFWGVPLVFFLGGAGITAGLSPLDDTIKQRVAAHPYLGKWNTIADWAGSAYVIDGASALVYIGGLASKDEEWRRTGEVLVEALVFTEAAAAGLKYAVNRQRPNGGGQSFPSSHAARTFAAASALTTLYGWYGVPALAAAAAISVSRVTSNSHYLSDVLFGATLGATIGYGTAYFHKHDRKLLFTVAPLTTESGGGGIQVSGVW